MVLGLRDILDDAPAIWAELGSDRWRDAPELFDRTLRVRIEGLLCTEPVPEAVTFETLVRPTTLDVAVRQAS